VRRPGVRRWHCGDGGGAVSKTEQNRTDQLIAAIWRATARALATDRIWSAEEQSKAIRAAEHVEEMLELTGQLYSPQEESR